MATRERTCADCGAQFAYVIGRGTDRRYCSETCAKHAASRSQATARASWPMCSVEGCDVRVRSAKAIMCEKHYGRIRRNGSLELRAPQPTRMHTHGYVLVYSPNHQLSSGTYVYEHRLVYHEAHGNGPFRCHWCGIAVTWATMHVDHVNAIKDDNRIENLVASCAGCNQWRGKEAMTRTMRARGRQISHDGETLCITEWAERLGISRASIQWRLDNGWTVARALTEPRGRFGPRAKRNRAA